MVNLLTDEIGEDKSAQSGLDPMAHYLVGAADDFASTVGNTFTAEKKNFGRSFAELLTGIAGLMSFGSKNIDVDLGPVQSNFQTVAPVDLDPMLESQRIADFGNSLPEHVKAQAMNAVSGVQNSAELHASTNYLNNAQLSTFVEMRNAEMQQSQGMELSRIG